jgi:hypothetical protein
MSCSFFAWDGKLSSPDDNPPTSHIEGDVNMSWATARTILRALDLPTDGVESGQGDSIERAKLLPRLQDLANNYASRASDHEALLRPTVRHRVEQILALAENTNLFFISYA